MSKYMNKFNVKQYLYFAENSAANFYFGDRKDGGGYASGPSTSRPSASRPSASRPAHPDDSVRAVAGRAESASVAGKPADDQKNAVTASVTPSASSSASQETVMAGANINKPDKAANTAENLKSSDFFRGENLLNGIMMAEILGKPKYLRKGRW